MFLDGERRLRVRAIACLMFIFWHMVLQLTNSNPVLAIDRRTKKWNEVRYSGLVEFSNGHYNAAKWIFEKALVSSRVPKRDGQKETLSTYDLAQVYTYMGKNKEAELYYKRALSLAKRAFSPHSAEVTLMLTQLAELFHSEHRNVEEQQLRKQIELNITHPHADFIGAASTDKNGDITEYMRASGPSTEGLGIVTIKKTDKNYKDEILHLGPMKPGEQTFILPYRYDPNEPEPVVPPPPPPHPDDQ
jgi:tetratricopeptide (TPR) repeat protein